MRRKHMKHVTSRDGARISYVCYGDGPPLVLVHGGFSDHETNWDFVKPLLQDRFTVYAVARRGRGQTDATDGHTLRAEAEDVAAVVRSVDSPVFVLGHSYGAHCALGAAALVLESVAKLVLYEPPWPSAMNAEAVAHLEQIAESENWNELVATFMTDILLIAPEEVKEIQGHPRRDREAGLRPGTRRRYLAAELADAQPSQTAGQHRASLDEPGVAADVAGATVPDPVGVPRSGRRRHHR
jgi:pimeloyl-ACP methyl ester carboxylesterase